MTTMLPKSLALWTLALGLLCLHSYATHAHRFALLSVPPYFSVLFLGLLGLLGWTLNLWILGSSGIPMATLLDVKKTLPSPTGPTTTTTGDSSASGLRRLWALLLALSTLSVLSFHAFLSYVSSLQALESFADNEKEEEAEFIPLWTYALLLLFLLNPSQTLFHRERLELHNSLKRIALGGLWDPVPFCDVLFADILTSFSRVLGDLHFVLSDLVFSEELAKSSWMSSGLELLVPILVW
jgi:hypothetical protein